MNKSMIKTMVRSIFDSICFFRCLLGLQLLFVCNISEAQSSIYSVNSTTTKSISSSASLLSEYITIPSETLHENDAATFLREHCRNKGLFIKQITDSIGSVNFAASLYPLELGKPNIIFLNHMDVVSAGNADQWKYPPYSGKIADGKVWGRGALDNKGLGIIQLSAIEKYVSAARTNDLPYNVTLLCVSGEETGGANGSAKAAKNFSEVFTPAVVIGEGGSGIDEISFLPGRKTLFGISVAEKGFFWLKISCELHSAGHASVAGNNYANEHLINGLQRLVNSRQRIQMTKESKAMFKTLGKNVGGVKGFAMSHINSIFFRPFLKHSIKKYPELESVFCNKVTVSNLGNFSISPNQNAQEAIAIVDSRYLPGNSPANIIKSIQKELKDTLLHISVIKKGSIPYTTTPEFFYGQLVNSIKNTFPEADVIPLLFPASSDNSYYRVSGCPVYGLNPMIISPAQLNSIHNIDEFIDLEDIDQGIEVFENFLNSILFSTVTANPGGLTRRQ